MMFTIGKFNKFKRELNQLLSVGGSLSEDGESFIDFITNLADSKGVLDLVRGLKEEGNACFKQKNFEDALEKYVPKGAVAAIEIGRKAIAYWDLKVANEIDPDNQEILRKLQHVEKSLSSSISKKHQHDECPAGLGSGLSSPMKKAKSRTVKEEGNDQVSEEKNVSEFKERYNLQRICVDKEKEEIMKETDEEIKEVPKEDRNEVMKAAAVQNSFNAQDKIDKMEVVDENKDQQMKEVKGVSHVNNGCEKVKFMYRFSNRRRPDSFLSISRTNYELLKKGHSIQCVNTKMNSITTIRVIQDSSSQQDKTKVKCDQMDWHKPSKKDLSEHANEVDPTKPLFAGGNERVGNTGAINKRTYISHANHTLKRKRKRRSSLSISVRKMKTTKPCSLKKHRLRKRIVNRGTPINSTPVHPLQYQVIKDRKRKDFSPPLGCSNRQGKRRQVNSNVCPDDVCINHVSSGLGSDNVNNILCCVNKEVNVAHVKAGGAVRTLEHIYFS